MIAHRASCLAAHTTPTERVLANQRLRRIGRIASNSLFVLLFLGFAWANFSSWQQTGRPAGLGTTVLEAWTAMLFVARRPPSAVSGSWLAWLAVPLGSFAMLLARPFGGNSTTSVVVAETLQLLGLALVLASLTTLGRSFGLVAANRGLKTRGPYRCVRHPAYGGYLVAYLGYVAENPSPRNVGLLCISTCFQLVRIHHEEAILRDDQGYRAYCEQVRFRLLPYVY